MPVHTHGRLPPCTKGSLTRVHALPSVSVCACLHPKSSVRGVHVPVSHPPVPLCWRMFGCGSPGACMPPCLGCPVGGVWSVACGCVQLECRPVALPPHRGESPQVEGPEVKSCPPGSPGQLPSRAPQQNELSALSTLVPRTPTPPPAPPRAPSTCGLRRPLPGNACYHHEATPALARVG